MIWGVLDNIPFCHWVLLVDAGANARINILVMR